MEDNIDLLDEWERFNICPDKQNFVYPQDEPTKEQKTETLKKLIIQKNPDMLNTILTDMFKEFLSQFAKLSIIQQKIVSALIRDPSLKVSKLAKELDFSYTWVFRNCVKLNEFDVFNFLVADKVLKNNKKC